MIELVFTGIAQRLALQFRFDEQSCVQPTNERASMSECPFGPSMQKYWDRLSPQEREMKLDREALYSLIIQPAALQTAARTPGEHVIDAFCGAGGSAIGFARSGKRVTAIELNRERLEMARYNAELFGVAHRITFIEGDSLVILPQLTDGTAFLAPPWGGPEYTKRPLFTLECFNPHGYELLRLALAVSKTVVMQLPRNFDLNEFKGLRADLSVFEDRFNGELLSYTATVSSVAD